MIPSSPVGLVVGDALPGRSVGPFTRTDFARYAGAGGDFNPIHHDEPFAIAAGTPTVFGMGLLHAGMLGVQLARWVGPDNVLGFAVRFTGQVWPGDVLVFGGVVDAVEDGVASLSLRVTRGEDVVLKATASARVA